jgi:nucleotide-binding universal stress UspA family protein
MQIKIFGIGTSFHVRRRPEPAARGPIMIKDILLPVSGSRGDAATLEVAIATAESSGAHLAVLIVVPLFIPLAFEWGAIPGELYARVHEENRAQAGATAARIRARLQASSIRSEVRVVESQVLGASRVAALHARHADLAIVASAAGDKTAAVAEGIFFDLLTDSGRPVLVVPPQAEARSTLRHAVVAWQPTRESSRALHDALPLLASAQTVDVLMIDPVAADNRHGEQPGADIATHLARHGLKVRVVAAPSMGEPVEVALLRHAVQSGADLVVAGGYSHARWREALLGGATRTLLESAPMPVLFSH